MTLTLKDHAERLAFNNSITLANQIRVAQWALDEWRSGGEGEYLVAFDRMAEQAQITAERIAVYERLASGSVENGIPQERA